MCLCIKGEKGEKEENQNHLYNENTTERKNIPKC